MERIIQPSLRWRLLWVAIFAITMGYFESAVVSYLREMYYPAGFEFPLKNLPFKFLTIEIGREAASIFMLLAVANLTGRIFIDKFAVFCFCFGVWDITYYLFLLLFEGWPPHPGTIDLLFLIPAPWIGPVWAPVMVSIALIWASIRIWRMLERGIILKPSRSEWVGEIVAGVIIIGSFLWGAPAAVGKADLPSFPWYIWGAGMVLGIVIFMRSSRRHENVE